MILTNLCQEIKVLEKKREKTVDKGPQRHQYEHPHHANQVKKHIPNKCKFCPNLSKCISLAMYLHVVNQDMW